MTEWILDELRKPIKVRLNNIVIETSSEFSMRLIEIIWDMFFTNTNVNNFDLDNPDISKLKKATLSKFFLILEAELREIIKSKPKLSEEVPRLYVIIYKVYKERKVISEDIFRDYVCKHFKERMWVDDLIKIIIEWFTQSLKIESVYV